MKVSKTICDCCGVEVPDQVPSERGSLVFEWYRESLPNTCIKMEDLCDPCAAALRGMIEACGIARQATALAAKRLAEAEAGKEVRDEIQAAEMTKDRARNLRAGMPFDECAVHTLWQQGRRIPLRDNLAQALEIIDYLLDEVSDEDHDN